MILGYAQSEWINETMLRFCTTTADINKFIMPFLASPHYIQRLAAYFTIVFQLKFLLLYLWFKMTQCVETHIDHVVIVHQRIQTMHWGPLFLPRPPPCCSPLEYTSCMSITGSIFYSFHSYLHHQALVIPPEHMHDACYCLFNSLFSFFLTVL